MRAGILKILYEILTMRPRHFSVLESKNRRKRNESGIPAIKRTKAIVSKTYENKS